MIENWETLLQIILRLKTLNSTVKIILDPILKSSSGFKLHTEEQNDVFNKVLEEIYLLTPNNEEIKALFPEKSIEQTIEHISSKTLLYLKGGHREDKKGCDEIYSKDGVQLSIEAGDIEVYPKHGSGCILSSSIASNLALAYTIEDASLRSKKYTERFLNSSQSLLGTHLHVNS